MNSSTTKLSTNLTNNKNSLGAAEDHTSSTSTLFFHKTLQYTVKDQRSIIKIQKYYNIIINIVVKID